MNQSPSPSASKSSDFGQINFGLKILFLDRTNDFGDENDSRSPESLMLVFIQFSIFTDHQERIVLF